MTVVHQGKEKHMVLADAGSLEPAPKRSFKRGEIRGSWPENAWTIQIRSEERAGVWLRVAKWRGNNRWVPQPIKNPPEGLYADDKRWYEASSEWWGRPGGRGGYLLSVYDYENDRIAFKRVAGKNFSPVPLKWDDQKWGWVQDVYEHPSGRLFVFHEGPGSGNKVLERAKCRKECEVEDRDLPEVDGPFGTFVARGDDQLSVQIKNDWEHDAAKKLLHRDADGWKLETAPVADGEFRAMVAGTGGALVAVIGTARGEQLWRRGENTVWERVELPEGTEPKGPDALDLVRVDDQRMWLAINDEGEHAVYELALSELG
jgi:hypothetical protein